MNPATRSHVRGRQVAAALLLTATLFMTGLSAAHADRPTVIEEDNTGFACEFRPPGSPQVDVSINYDAVSEVGYSFAGVLSPDGELDLARGFTDEVTVGDGIVSARYSLVNEDGSDAGEVVLQGTYAPAADPLTLHNRFPYARNAQIIGTLTYTELAVTWTTLQVGSYTLTDSSCFGQRSQTTNRVLEPHRVVYRFEELQLLENCAQAPLTRFDVIGSEIGVSLAMETAERHGSTNLALGDGSDTQPVEWFADDEEGPVETTSITAGIAKAGPSHTTVEATPDGLVLERIQPLTFTYELGLPDDGGTVSGSCAAATVITRIAVEPVENQDAVRPDR